MGSNQAWEANCGLPMEGSLPFPRVSSDMFKVTLYDDSNKMYDKSKS
jgi:hypothetical protein